MGVCSAKQKDPTQPGAPVPQPQQYETPVKQPPPASSQPVVIHFPSEPPPEPAPILVPPSPVPVAGSPEMESDLLADLRNQPSLEANEAEERRRQEEEARLARIREEAEQARLREEEERRAADAERLRLEEIAAAQAREEEAERLRLEAEEHARVEAAAAAEALRKAEEERERAQRFIEESRAASRAEAQRLAEEAERAREEEERRLALEREERARAEEAAAAEVERAAEEERQRIADEAEALRRQQEEAEQAERDRAEREIALQKAQEEAEEAQRREAEDKIAAAIAERKREVKSKIEDLQERTGVSRVRGLNDHNLFFCELLWLEDFTGMKIEKDLSNFKSGEVLCKAINIVQPQSANYTKSVSKWKQSENILAFINACETLGLRKEALFAPSDLLEGQNMNNVVKTLDVFYKFVSKRDGFNGPVMPSPEDAADENSKRSSVSTPAHNRSPPGKALELGMHADMRQKEKQKFAKEAPNIEKVTDWIKKLSGTEIKDFQEGLRSGEVLCKAMNKIQKGSIKKINSGTQPFLQRENIDNFIGACKELGLKDQELFEPNDLYEGKNLLGVAECLISLSRLLRAGKVAEFRGPYIPELGGGIHTRVVTFYSPGQSANPSSVGEHSV